MANNYITRSEVDRIIEMQKQGCSYRAIGKELGRDASSVYRIVSGERGTFWKSHKAKPWRCADCGNLIRDHYCRACRLNNERSSTQKNRDSVKEWWKQIRQKDRLQATTVLRVIHDEYQSKDLGRRK